MVWLATLNDEVLKAAVPPLRATVARVVLPSLKVTLPVGVPEPGLVAVTAAVNVTVWPDVADVGDAVSATLVAAWPTVRVKEAALTPNVALPP
jgi:hypothetical protein